MRIKFGTLFKFNLDNLTYLAQVLSKYVVTSTNYKSSDLPDEVDFLDKKIPLMMINTYKFEDYRKLYPFASKTVWLLEIVYALKKTSRKEKVCCALTDVVDDSLLTIMIVDLKTFQFQLSDEVIIYEN